MGDNMNEHDAKLAAADIMDKAHDVLLETGVHCLETRKSPQGHTLFLDGDDDTPNCLWQAVALAAGCSASQWNAVWDQASVREDTISHPLPNPVAKRLPGYIWNDHVASVDDVFDVLLSSAKQLREEAAIIAAAESLPDMQSLVDSQVDV